MIQRVQRTTSIDLALALRIEPTTFRRVAAPRPTLVIRNVGADPVLLVDPGDGSDAGWRPPFVGWTVVPAGPAEGASRGRSDDLEPTDFEPDLFSLLRPARGGNVDPFDLESLFALGPGESHRLSDWAGRPGFPMPGRYRVAFHYRNEPDAEICGLPFDEHDPIALALLRESERCRLTSHEVVVDVLD